MKRNIIIAIALLLAVAFIPSAEATPGTWANTSFNYRNCYLENGTYNTNYQLQKNITYGANMQADFSDIRPYRQNSTVSTALTYFIESKLTSAWANVWVKSDYVDSGNDEWICYYYKNLTAVKDASDDNNTFITPLRLMGGQWTQQGGARLSNQSAYSMQAITLSNNYGNVYKNISGTGNNLLLKGRMNATFITHASWMGMLAFYWKIGSDSYTGAGIGESRFDWYTVNNLTAAIGGVGSASANTYYWFKVWLNATDVTYYYSADDISYTTIATKARMSGWNGEPTAIVVGKGTTQTGYAVPFLANDLSSGTNMGETFDNITVRNYMLPEPTQGAFAGEELIFGATVLNISVFNNQTGAAMTNWQLNITNGTATYSAINQNNPSLFNNLTVGMVYGNSNITISDGSTTLYFFNRTYVGNINSTLAWNLNATLQPKSNNPVSLLSSAGWTLIEGAITTLTCTVAEGATVGFWINDVAVGSPYTLTTAKGTYAVTCGAEAETTNYAPVNTSNTLVVNSLFACTKNNIFAFSASIPTTSNQTTLNFTNLVNAAYLKKNLGDVNVSNVNQTWINTTGGYYVIVNNTGVSTLNVSFGNYYANQTYTTSARLGNVSAISSYTQINPFIEYNILDELSGAYFFPPNATVTSIISCASGDTYVPIGQNDTKFIIATAEPTIKASARVLYSASEYYSRQLYTSSADVLRLNFYVTDAFVNPLDRIDFIVQDINYYNSKFQIYKTQGNESIIITEGYFDASHLFSAYLLEDIDYQLRTQNQDGTYTAFDRMTIVAPATKYIGNVKMYLNPDAVLISEKILMNAWMSSDRTTLYVKYADALNQTNSVNILILYENGSVFQNATYTGVNTVEANYPTAAYVNNSFSVYYSVNHQTLGNSPVSFGIFLNPGIGWDLGVSSMLYRIFALVGIILIGGITARKTIVGGSVMLLISIIIFKAIGWLPISTLNIFFIAVLLVLGVFMYHKQGGE